MSPENLNPEALDEGDTFLALRKMVLSGECGLSVFEPNAGVSHIGADVAGRVVFINDDGGFGPYAFPHLGQDVIMGLKSVVFYADRYPSANDVDVLASLAARGKSVAVVCSPAHLIPAWEQRFMPGVVAR